MEIYFKIKELLTVMIFVGSTPEHNMFYWISPEMHGELLELGYCWGEGIVNLRSSSDSEIVYFPNIESMTLSPSPALVRICFLFPTVWTLQS